MVPTKHRRLNREGIETPAGRGKVIAAVEKARTEVSVFQLSTGTAFCSLPFLASVSEIAAMLYPSLHARP